MLRTCLSFSLLSLLMVVYVDPGRARARINVSNRLPTRSAEVGSMRHHASPVGVSPFISPTIFHQQLPLIEGPRSIELMSRSTFPLRNVTANRADVYTTPRRLAAVYQLRIIFDSFVAVSSVTLRTNTLTRITDRTANITSRRIIMTKIMDDKIASKHSCRTDPLSHSLYWKWSFRWVNRVTLTAYRSILLAYCFGSYLTLHDVNMQARKDK